MQKIKNNSVTQSMLSSFSFKFSSVYLKLQSITCFSFTKHPYSYATFLWLFWHLLYKTNARFCSIQNSPWQLVNAEAFAEAYLCFLVSASAKKNAEAIKCLIRILKKYVAKNKIYFCFEKKRNVPLNKKVIFIFHTIFNIYCIIHRCLYSLFILLSFSNIGF